MLIFIILLIGVYVILAILFVSSIWKHFRKRLYLWLAVAFVILLPTWDAVLGYIVYCTACPFMKVVIYETAETDGIYYEGEPRTELMSFDVPYLGAMQTIQKIPFSDNDFGRGYRYVESLITSVGDASRQTPLSPPRSYRCTPLPRDPQIPQARHQQCIPVDEIQSGYAVKTKMLHVARNELNFMKIYNRATGQLMAEYRDVTLSAYEFIPFFGWLKWGPYDRGGHLYVCLEPPRLLNFQYEVLNVKK